MNRERREYKKMIPLTMIGAGEKATVIKVGGKEDTRRFLENLGFVAGTAVTVISDTGGNLIVSVKDSRIAIGRDMAMKVMV